MTTTEFLQICKNIQLPESVVDILKECPSCVFPKTRQEIFSMAMGHKESGVFNVEYELADGKTVTEATVSKGKNGLAINYTEPYMRRRDPGCMVVADDGETDKTRYSERFKGQFEDVRQQSFEWLKSQNLSATMFTLGGLGAEQGKGAMLIAPANAGFFVGGLADLQGLVTADEVGENFTICSVIYLVPPFRHTHFDGKQVVVHNRLEDVHEVFSYNLYPGPSAKKGVYGVLLAIGESEAWPTLHASTVQVETPYDNVTTIMHEGASGGGKSEMLEQAHRQEDGRLLLGKNLVTGQQKHLVMTQTCKLYPVTDDMALCKPLAEAGEGGYLKTTDAEQAWFVRVNHITNYGTEPHLEATTIHPKEPLLFINIDSVPGATTLIWEHIEDAPGKPCPNPRVILPRRLAPNVIEGTVDVMIRSFGVRTPPCTREKPTYGILGFVHLLPPSLAWLWRLVAPRGHGNPSITDSEGLLSEGVGSYWPFATGRIVDHANLLLRQMQSTDRVRYVLIPNQHVGSWHTSFMPQWITREYLARRGTAPFREHQIAAARCPLLGYNFSSMQVEGTQIPQWLLNVASQPEVGTEGYDAGAKILVDFFARELQKFLHPDLDKLGKDIITCCLDGGGVEDYEKLLDHPASR